MRNGNVASIAQAGQAEPRSDRLNATIPPDDCSMFYPTKGAVPVRMRN